MRAPLIHPRQVLMLFVVSRVAVTLVYFPGMNNPELKQDVWLASLLGALAGIPLVWLLRGYWAGRTAGNLLDMGEAAFGPWGGRLLGLLWAVWFLLGVAVMARAASEFFAITILPRTPLIAIILLVCATAFYGVRLGLEALARFGQITFWLTIITVLITPLAVGQQLDPAQLRPVFVESGAAVLFKESINVVARTSEFVSLLLFPPPLLNERRRFGRYAVYALLIEGLIWTIMATTITAVLGAPQQLAVTFPFYEAVKVIDLANFVQRIDSALLVVWFFGMVVRIAVMHYSFAIAAAYVAGVEDYRPLVYPLGAIGVSLSVILVDNFTMLQDYFKPENFTPYMLVFVVLLPLLILWTAQLRQRWGWVGPGRAGNAGEPQRTSRQAAGGR